MSLSDTYLLQRISQDELWDIMHDPEKKGVVVPDHPAFFCVFAGGLVRFWPPLTDDMQLSASRMRIGRDES